MDESNDCYRSLCSAETLRSGTKGFFHEFAETVVEEAGQTWIAQVFAKSRDDRQRLAVLVNGESRVCDVVNETLSRVQRLYRAKDPEISRDKRMEAQRLVAGGQNFKALLVISQAVLRAPATGIRTHCARERESINYYYRLLIL